MHITDSSEEEFEAHVLTPLSQYSDYQEKKWVKITMKHRTFVIPFNKPAYNTSVVAIPLCNRHF